MCYCEENDCEECTARLIHMDGCVCEYCKEETEFKIEEHKANEYHKEQKLVHGSFDGFYLTKEKYPNFQLHQGLQHGYLGRNG